MITYTAAQESLLQYKVALYDRICQMQACCNTEKHDIHIWPSKPGNLACYLAWASCQTHQLHLWATSAAVAAWLVAEALNIIVTI